MDSFLRVRNGVRLGPFKGGRLLTSATRLATSAGPVESAARGGTTASRPGRPPSEPCGTRAGADSDEPLSFGPTPVGKRDRTGVETTQSFPIP